MPWLSRLFFCVVAALALGGMLSGVACTRRGKSSPIPPTSSPLTTINVNPKTGSDTTGDGTTASPYRTLTKAVAVATNATTPLTILLSPGVYAAANGERFPIVIPTGMTIEGTGYGVGSFQTKGSFINGAGEDVAYEKISGKPNSRTAFATLEVAANVTGVTLSRVYVGSTQLPLPAAASYAAADALGALTASHATFAAGTSLTRPKVAAAIVPSGTISCTACTLLGSDYALLAFTISGLPPTVFLSGEPTQSIIGARIGIYTDGSATVTAAYQTFQSKTYGYRDSFVAPIASPSMAPGIVDFGQGPTSSAGGNIFIGPNSVISEVSVTLPQSLIYALGDTWNRLTQGSNASGQYPRPVTFGPGDHGRNVTVDAGAAGSSVLVGPVPPPSPTPMPSPTGTGGPTTSPSPTG